MTKHPPKPKCAAYLERGISNSAELLNALNAVAADVAASRITPTQGNALFADLRNILKLVELKQKFGRQISRAQQIQWPKSRTAPDVTIPTQPRKRGWSGYYSSRSESF